jgi:Bacterial Ig-like domain (group 3).
LELDSIHLVVSPTKTTYFVGEQLDLDGTVIGAVYNDGTSTVITDLCTFSPADGDILNEEGEQAVIATYEEGTDVYTVDIPIEVIHRDSLDYLIYTEEPTRYVVTNINVTAIQRDSVNSLEIESEYNQKSTTLNMQ